MILVGAILLAIYVVDGVWELVIVAGAVVVEIGETAFWIWWTKRRRPTVGREALVGLLADVVRDCAPEGLVRVHGELWKAHCFDGARAGERVRVRAVEGLTLDVDRVE